MCFGPKASRHGHLRFVRRRTCGVERIESAEGMRRDRGGAVLGLVDLRQICSTFLSPFGLG